MNDKNTPPQHSVSAAPAVDPRDEIIARLSARLDELEKRPPAGPQQGVGGTLYPPDDDPEASWKERRRLQRKAALRPHPQKMGMLRPGQMLADKTVIDAQHCKQQDPVRPTDKDAKVLPIMYQPDQDGATIIGGPYDGKRL